MIIPEKGKKLDEYNKNSKYIVRLNVSEKFSEALFEYANNYHEAVYLITEKLLKVCNTRKLDTYFLVIAFLYRHCLEMGMKAIVFQYVKEKKIEEFLLIEHSTIYLTF